jgi:hypothetical protein
LDWRPSDSPLSCGTLPNRSCCRSRLPVLSGTFTSLHPVGSSGSPLPPIPLFTDVKRTANQPKRKSVLFASSTARKRRRFEPEKSRFRQRTGFFRVKSASGSTGLLILGTDVQRDLPVLPPGSQITVERPSFKKRFSRQNSGSEQLLLLFIRY